jgi:signal transduction histidine kinase
MNIKNIYICLFPLLLPFLALGQDLETIPQSKDSLTEYILNKRSLGEKGWNYYHALKKLSEQTMFDDRKKTADYLSEAYDLALNFNDTIEMAAIAHMQGKTFRHWGYTYAAAEFFQHSYILTEQVGRRNYAGFDLLNIGNLYFDLEKWEEAKTYFNRSLEVFEKTGERSGMAVAYNNLGLNARKQKKYDQAIDYFNQGLKVRQEFKDSILIAHSLYYLAATYQQMHMNSKGLKTAKEALRIFTNPANANHEHYDILHLPLSLYYFMGEMHYDLEDYPQAEACWEKALEIGRAKPKLSEHFLRSYSAYARLKEKQDDPRTAIDLLEEGINFATTLHFVDEQEQLLLQISDLLAKEGDYAESLSYLRERYALMKRKALGASNQMLNFHAIFETYEQKTALHEKELQLQKERLEKQQQDRLVIFYSIALGILVIGLIAVLSLLRRINLINRTIRQRNEAIEKQKDIIQSNAEELKELNETKDLLFSIIAHDLRSPFNSLTNFSKLMQTYIQNNQWQDLKASFRVLDEASQKAYWTFENLLGWIQSQTGKLAAEVESVDIRPLLEESEGLLSSMQLMKRVSIHKEIQVPYIKADPYMLQTILRNLLTNAIKFSHDKGKIFIKTEARGDQVIISLQDNGIGMSPSAIKELFNTQKLRASSNSVSGLGLIICKKFVEIMQGEIRAESQIDRGTIFIISLPIGEATENKTDIGKHETKVAENSTIDDFDLLQQSKHILIKSLSEYKEEIEQYSVYEASMVKEIVSKIQQKEHLEKEVELWLSYLNQAVYIADPEMFKDLMELLEDE